MSPLRWDVLAVGFLLALPVLALGMRGDLTVEEVTSRLPWCLAAGWAAVALVRLATTPHAGSKVSHPSSADPARAENEPSPV